MHKSRHQQYTPTHELVGQTVRLRGTNTIFIVQKVVPSRFGTLVPVPGTSTAYTPNQLEIITS